jgi:hypothetical protein
MEYSPRMAHKDCLEDTDREKVKCFFLSFLQIKAMPLYRLIFKHRSKEIVGNNGCVFTYATQALTVNA